MSVVDRTQPAQSQTLAFEIELPHPREKVWRALTDPALLSEWLLQVVELALEPGASFVFRTQPHPGWDGTVHCTVLEVTPHERLRYTWAVGGMALDTVVTFTLAATPAGTLLQIEQSGFTPEQKQNFGGARYGWRLMGGRLVALLGAGA